MAAGNLACLLQHVAQEASRTKGVGEDSAVRWLHRTCAAQWFFLAKEEAITHLRASFLQQYLLTDETPFDDSRACVGCVFTSGEEKALSLGCFSMWLLSAHSTWRVVAWHELPMLGYRKESCTCKEPSWCNGTKSRGAVQACNVATAA